MIVITNGSFAALVPTSQVLASVPEKDAGLLEPLQELGCSTTHNNMDTVTHRQGVKLEIIRDNPRSFAVLSTKSTGFLNYIV